MTGPVLLAITAIIVGAAWMRVATLSYDDAGDPVRAHRQLLSMLLHAIMLSCLLGGLCVMAIIIQATRS